MRRTINLAYCATCKYVTGKVILLKTSWNRNLTSSMQLIKHTREFLKITRTQEKPNLMTTVVTQAWFTSSQDFHVFQLQYCMNFIPIPTLIPWKLQ